MSHDQIERALAARDWQLAYSLCKRLVDDNPGDATALAGLATIAEAHGNLSRAAPLLAQALDAAPGDSRIAAQYARLLSRLSRQREAEEIADRAVAMMPQDGDVLDTLGVILSRAGRHEEAADLFASATAKRPRDAGGWRNLAGALRFCGRFGQAEAAYAKAIELDPDDAESWLAKVGLRRQSADDDPTPQLTTLWDRRGDDPDQALRIGHALAKVAEDLQDRDAAMEWLAKAKSAKATQVAHDPDATDRLYAAAAATCEGADLPRCADRPDAPVLVVGAPRTGTTLVDRILSSHPALVSVGESPALSIAVKRLAQTRSNRVLDEETMMRARSIAPDAIAQAYRDALAPMIEDGKRSVDKMPLNLCYAGLAHRAMPDARIVRLRRHPLDAVLANWRQLFAPRIGHYDHNWSLEHVARWIVAIERLAAHWSAVLPAERYCEIDYEMIVTQQEQTTRKLLAFVGVEWDKRTLRFQENAAPVSTASAVQVRQPLHSRSVGVWRKVERHLAPAIAVLRKAGIIDDAGNPIGVAARPDDAAQEWRASSE